MNAEIGSRLIHEFGVAGFAIAVGRVVGSFRHLDGSYFSAAATAASTPSGLAPPKQQGQAVCQRLRPSANAFSMHLHSMVVDLALSGLQTAQPGSSASWIFNPNSRLQVNEAA